MARRHGWQLPAHSLQVIAITVYFLLSIAFYAFFAPFLGKDLYERVAMGVYSFLVLSVLILYVRCTAIDPADPGILIAPRSASAYKSTNKAQSGDWPQAGPIETASRAGVISAEYKSASCGGICGLCCGFLVKEDCHRDEDSGQQQANCEEALFCTLCNAEQQNFGKSPSGAGAGSKYEQHFTPSAPLLQSEAKEDLDTPFPSLYVMLKPFQSPNGLDS